MSVGIAATNEGTYFAWQDTRNGNYENEAEDVYAATALVLGGLVLLLGTRFARRGPGGEKQPAPARSDSG